MTAPRPENRLARETSPYLLQHAHNPVDWYAWGDEAFARARSEDKPIFLSIGYSACHWCHVMEHESFETAQVADALNRDFVSIKVDREERPDVDDIYMQAVTALTGSGGWPMSVFLTPALEPFFGATYLPPVRRHGRPSFPDVLVGLAEAYRDDRSKVTKQAQTLTDHIRAQASADLRGALEGDPVERAASALMGSFDATWGGFGGAPKFPHAGALRLLLRSHARSGDARTLHAVTHTLDRMAAGGLYDQLGGGFHRYSTDEEWRIPHFEKMLYDNAQLVVAYLEGFLVTGNADYARIARESCDWALREMVTPEGAFASAQDADSEGEEGRFFAWTPDELIEVLGREDGRIAALYWDVTAEGNFEDGKSALWRRKAASEVAAELGVSLEALEARMQDARAKLLTTREQRVKPMTDDKVLVAWNGLMISALALAHQQLGEPRHLDAARRAARYVLERMAAEDGGLHATARAGRAHLRAGLDDYAFFTQALLDLFETDFDPRWLGEARRLCERTEQRFADTALGGYFTTEAEVAELITRSKSVHDGALPAGSAVQALNLSRLSELCGRPELGERARAVIDALAGLLNRHPRAFAQLLLAHDFAERDPLQVVVSGAAGAADTQRLLASVRGTFRPQRVVALASGATGEGALPLLECRAPSGGPARVYVCRAQTCLAPIEDADSLVNALRQR